MIRRREAITLLGGAAAAWPLTARAQQAAMPVIGLLGVGSPEIYEDVIAVFRKGLNDTGYIEGRNVAIEYRWAHGHYDRLPVLAAELVQHRVSIMVTNGGIGSALAAKAVSKTIPIVCIIDTDPITAGLVTSLNKPSGNLTGVTLFNTVLGAKRLELLRDLVPNFTAVALLVNPENPNSKNQVKDIQEAAQVLGPEIKVVNASDEHGLRDAFSIIIQARAEVLLVTADAFFNAQRDRLVALAASQSLPAMYEQRGFVEAGGLMSYGATRSGPYFQLGTYTGRILKGEKPADLPVVQPTKFELVLNLKTAKALGLDVPPTLLARADEVIE
jgi:putative ABC transport system substrate-binding protein